MLLDRVIWSPSHLNCDQLECSIGLNSLSSQEERKVVDHTVSILASHEFNQLRCLFTERQSVNLLNLVSLLNFGSCGHLRLLNLHEVQLSEVLLSANTVSLLAVFGDFWCIFLHHLGLNEKEEAHQGGLIGCRHCTGRFKVLVRNKVELRDTISGVVVLGLEHCSPQGKIKNHDQTLTEEDSRAVSGATHHSKVKNRTILELARNLQFSLHRGIHHVHVRGIGPRELQAKHPVRLLAENKHASRFRAIIGSSSGSVIALVATAAWDA